MVSEGPRRRQGKRDAGRRGPREKVYDTQIAPLLEQIFALCEGQDIDFVMAFALDDEGERTRIAGSSRLRRDDVECLTLAQAIVSGKAHIGVVEVSADDVLRTMPPQGRA